MTQLKGRKPIYVYNHGKWGYCYVYWDGRFVHIVQYFALTGKENYILLFPEETEDLIKALEKLLKRIKAKENVGGGCDG